MRRVTKTCPVCGDEFARMKSRESTFCGKACARAYANKTHGDSKTVLYSRWKEIKKRCTATRGKNHTHYAGRGISVCREWMESFEAFRNWAFASGYGPALEIDRIDFNGNYEPSNCRWVTNSIQAQNRRSTVWLTAHGETRTMKDWGEALGIRPAVIRKRLRAGMSSEEALSR